MDDAEPFTIEYSTLCGYLSQDGFTVRVVICRLKDSGDPWALEVIDAEGTSTAWDTTFPTERDALQEFHRTLEREGIASFLS